MTDTPPEVPATDFDNLVRLLTNMVTKLDYSSEAEQEETAHLLRHVEEDLGVSGVVPPERAEPGA